MSAARTDWSDGYISDVAYTDGYYAELSPAHLNYIAILNNCAPRPIDRPFTYCELGCGNGHTVTMLAAAYPQGQFYGVDFNPAHVAKARRWAEAAGIKNLTILEASFQEMVEMDLPDFDFITFHGIYSWISEPNRRAMQEVMARHLQPGGLVYNSYNCMPGWAGQAPLQRLMLEIARSVPGDSLIKAGGAIEFLQQLTAAESRYLKANSTASALVSKLATRPRSYIAHEYLNEEWHPLYCLDVFREMGMAKLSFVGSANVSENHPNLMFRQEARELFDAQPTRERKQLVKDFLLNQRFRCDVYVKGLSTLSAAEARERMWDMSIGLIKPPEDVIYTAKYGVGELNFDHAMSRAIISVLSRGAITVGELAKLGGLARVSETRLQTAVNTLISAGQVSPFAAPVSRAPKPLAKKGKLSLPMQVNRHVAATATDSGSRSLMASTIAGRGVHVDLYDRLFLHQQTNGHATNVPEAVFAQVSKQGFAIKRGDEVVKGKEASIAELQRKFETHSTKTLPLLLNLGILEEA